MQVRVESASSAPLAAERHDVRWTSGHGDSRLEMVMQDFIEEMIRGVGYLSLRVVTLGRYRGAGDSRLAEGAIGFGLVVVAAYLIYAVRAG